MIHIGLAFDETYAMHGGATIASILANSASDDDIEFHILNNGIAGTTETRLQEYVQSKGAKIQFIKLGLDRFSSFPTDHHAAAAYSRLALPELLPDLNRIIYLDSDIIVLKSLRPLWETRLDGGAAAAVRDAADVFGSHFVEHKQRLGLRVDQPAFNSGVMLMNLEVWRQNAFTSSVVTWIREKGNLMLHSDQCALNAVLKDRICILDPAWNVQAPLIRAVRYGGIHNTEWITAVRDPAIIHYTTKEKPWNSSCAVPRRADYGRYAKMFIGRGRGFNLPTSRQAFQRFCAEATQFQRWLAALIKGQLRRI